MKKTLLIILIIIAGAFLLIQLIPSGMPENHPVKGEGLLEIAGVPAETEAILRAACFDCHSQEAKFPWYSHVAPVSWLVAKDINHGREKLDFSHWGKLSKREKLTALGEISEEVENENMPMPIYISMHPEADLTPEQRETIIQWAEDAAEALFGED
jgi:hypothetical protein